METNGISGNVDPQDPIIEQLSDARIFSVYRDGEAFIFRECCDYHFDATLSKEEVLKLVQELIDLVNKPL
jgi:hypothetical protein